MNAQTPAAPASNQVSPGSVSPSSASAILPSPSLIDKAKIRIGPGDLLQLGVYDEPTLAQTVRVDDQGNTDLLLIGRQHLGGLSVSEASLLVQKLLKEGDFLLNPQVSLLIAEYNTQTVSVLGEVKKPGPYPVLGQRNLLDILSLAGGPTPFAANLVTIKRRSGAEETVKTALLNDPDRLLASRVEIEPGDTILVPKAGLVYVLGEVARPGAFIIQNDGAMSLAQAVAFASGVNYQAAQTKTRIIRKTTDGFNEQNVNLKRILEGKDPDPGLKPDDIVYIPSSAIKSLMARAPTIAQSAASAAVYEGMVNIP